MKKLVYAAIVSGLVGVAFAPARADEAKPEDAVKYRQAIMSVIGGHTGAFFAILSGKVPYNDALPYHADALAAATDHVGAAFEQNTTGSHAKTKAKDAIWAADSDFSKHVEDLEKAAHDLSAAVNAGDQEAIGVAAKALGGACKSCHDKFRKD
ncbi:MAG: hypothetical protein GC201_03855 [Alphaproteobacteria bacterium]|nr:hypothetical protein [Alphaproteobacteria bacterium]